MAAQCGGPGPPVSREVRTRRHRATRLRRVHLSAASGVHRQTTNLGVNSGQTEARVAQARAGRSASHRAKFSSERAGGVGAGAGGRGLVDVERDGLGWDDSKLRALDLQYHDVDLERGLYHRLVSRGAMRRLFDDSQILDAAVNPPTRTRAYFRGRCVSEFSDSLVAANWDSLVFDVGEDTLKRVPMMEPLRGGKDAVDALLERSPDAASLVRALGGEYGGAGQKADPA